MQFAWSAQSHMHAGACKSQSNSSHSPLGFIRLSLKVAIYLLQSSPTDLVIQVTLIAESVRLQQLLATYGIQTQTPHQIEPIQIWPPNELVKAYEQLGVNTKLGLTGRPPRPIGGLGTAKVTL